MQNKKLLGLALALALMLPYGQVKAAEFLKNLKLDGQIDLQATSANNVADLNTSAYNQIGDAQARVMLNAGWDLLDDVHAMVTLRKNDYAWGAGGGMTAPQLNIPGSSSQGLLNGGAGLNGVLDNVFADQAYFKVDKVFGAIDTTLGRQFYGEQGDIVIYFGPYAHLYGQGVSAIDAARFDWSNEMVGISGLVGKFTGSGINVIETGDVDVQGLNASFKGNDMWNAGAYLWERQTHNGGVNGGNDYLYIAGLKGKFMMGPAWVKGEFAKDFGENRLTATGPSMNYDGWAYKLCAGAKLDAGMASFTPWGELAVGSGGQRGNRNFTFTAINPDFRPGGIYGYFSSISADRLGNGLTGGTVTSNPYATNTNPGLGDKAIWGLGLKTTPSALSKLTVGLAFWNYSFQTKAGLQAGAAGNKHIGSEADLDLTWKHSDNVSFNVGFGSFQPGGYVGNLQAAHNPTTLYSFSTSVKF